MNYFLHAQKWKYNIKNLFDQWRIVQFLLRKYIHECCHLLCDVQLLAGLRTLGRPGGHGQIIIASPPALSASLRVVECFRRHAPGIHRGEMLFVFQLPLQVHHLIFHLDLLESDFRSSVSEITDTISDFFLPDRLHLVRVFV